MTNPEFAARIGVTESYASYLRNGQRRPSGMLLVKIIGAFDLDADAAMKAYQEGGKQFGTYLRDHVFTQGVPTEHAEHATSEQATG